MPEKFVDLALVIGYSIKVYRSDFNEKTFFLAILEAHCCISIHSKAN